MKETTCYRTHCLMIALTLLACPSLNCWADCVLDDSVFKPIGASNGVIHSVAIQSDGKPIVVGSFTTINNNPNYSRGARLNLDGSLDTGFFCGGNNGEFYAVAIQRVGTEDRPLIGGWFNMISDHTIYYLARLLTNGDPDYSFVTDSYFNSSVRAIAVQSDGKILVGGDFTTFGSSYRYHIARLLTNGALDTSFSVSGYYPGTDLAVRSIAVQDNGKILIGGDFTYVGSTLRSRVARLNTDGSLDTTFDQVPSWINNTIYSLAVTVGPFQQGSTNNVTRILVGGAFDYDSSRRFFTRLIDNGGWDSNFNPSISSGTDVRSVVVQADKKILIGGTFSTVGGSSRNNVARFVPNADLVGLDTSWTDGCATIGAQGGNVAAIALDANGKIFVGGGFTSFEGTIRRGIARLNP